MNRSIRAIAAAALGAVVMAATLWLAPHGDSSPVAASGLTQRTQISSCTGTMNGSVTTDTIRLCEPSQIVVDAEPGCSSCPGGLNVVFVELAEAFDAPWQDDAAIAVLNQLERIRSMTVRVAVIHYDSRKVETKLRLTEQLSRARGPLNQPPTGHDPHGDFVGAAAEAISILRDSRNDMTRQGLPTPCEAVVFFASTKSAFAQDEANMLKAASTIKREKVPLFVGCPEFNVGDYCRTTKKMPTKTSWYAEPPDTNKLANAMLNQTRQLERDAGVRTYALVQTVPPGLEIEDGSISPAPSEVTGDPGLTTTLRWEWRAPESREAHTLTFKLNPLIPGAWPLRGEMQITDMDGYKAKVLMAQQMITVTGPCDNPTDTPVPPPTETPVPTPTDTPAVPDTPVPPTATPLPPTATPTARPRPIYLPISVKQPACKSIEHHADVVLVLDMSTSMDRDSEDGAQKKAAVVGAAKSFVRRLDLTPNEDDQSDHVSVVGFNDDAWIQLKMTNDAVAIDAALDTLDARQKEGTRLDLAFRKGAEAFQAGMQATGNQSVLVLLTDGLPNRVPADPDTGRVEDTVIKAAQVAKDLGAIVYTIGFGRADAADLIDRVYPQLLADCASSPEKSFIEPRADRLDGIYGQIASVFTCPAGRIDWGGTAP
ncbi:MAG: vWA domain-containing protein [Ardenticatenales bacterium]